MAVKLDILAIAAHPDDVELGCAGTMMMEKRKGKKIGIVDLTRGELGTRGTPEKRLQEAKDAAEIMQLDARENADLADGFFENNRRDQLRVIHFIRKYRPEIVFTNAPEDRHPDHGRAAQLVKDAAWLSGLRKIETYEDGSLQEAWRPAYVFHFVQDRYLKPDFVFDISDAMDEKIRCIRAFTSQFDTQEDDEPQTYISSPAFLQSVIERAKAYGKIIGVPYAEGFLSDKTLGIKSFDEVVLKTT